MIENAASRAVDPEFEGASWNKSTYGGSDNGCIEHAALPSGRHAVEDTWAVARAFEAKAD
ncbi:hypothetical protein AMK21_19305 [Streptomyces sp. CB00316]|uniref:DUF397 domain-containing protein n=1 Tax=unclassified Streptomyces TaxID=2593676 RepID=UPI00093D2FC9|nr:MULTISPECIES: DUF397 domain-containing protein [unclassified Streptomyces]MBT2379518.1 DUF397 domain-containing protein [Streptomyces sp. ISL-111]MBT2428526.1 DUF397 domain-containing protein [Streptomyces sp. ISL-112]MBT2465187.1 DUF397 domain-containing protein [Streptomyces sp. ISL-63]OKJ19242.1 hypothetical protein AMK21_19305 [Streptomyces sp. CB00316]